MRKSETVNPSLKEEEKSFESSIRPSSFDEFAGQKKIVDNLKVFIGAAKK